MFELCCQANHYHHQELRGVVSRLEESMNTAKDELNTTMKLIAKVLIFKRWWRKMRSLKKGRQEIDVGGTRDQKQTDEHAHDTGYYFVCNWDFQRNSFAGQV